MSRCKKVDAQQSIKNYGPGKPIARAVVFVDYLLLRSLAYVEVHASVSVVTHVHRVAVVVGAIPDMDFLVRYGLAEESALAGSGQRAAV